MNHKESEFTYPLPSRASASSALATACTCSALEPAVATSDPPAASGSEALRLGDGSKCCSASSRAAPAAPARAAACSARDCAMIIASTHVAEFMSSESSVPEQEHRRVLRIAGKMSLPVQKLGAEAFDACFDAMDLAPCFLACALEQSE